MEGSQLSCFGIIFQNSNDHNSIEPLDFWYERGDTSTFSHSPANTHSRYRQPHFEQNAWVSGPETGPTFRPCHYVPSPSFSEIESDYFDPSISQWSSYIVHFEQVAFSNRWSESEKAERLIACLRGDAEDILSELTYFQCTNYATLKKVIDLKSTTPDSLRLRTNVFEIRVPLEHRQSNSQIGSCCEETMLSCDDCGLVFQNIQNLQSHIKKGYIEQSFKRKREGEEDGFLPAFKKRKNVSGEAEAFNCMMDKARKESEDDRMMDKARKESEDDWHKRVDKYIEGGLNEKEPKEKADERMHTIDMKSFYKLYGSFLLSLMQLNSGPIHEKVMSDIDKFIEKG
jgi:hypothetical protein